MKAKAETRFVRLSPRKARLVADLIRGKNALDALDILEYTNKKAAPIIKKTLLSAVNNASNHGANEDNLVVETIMINQGPTLKRMKPRAMGRADIRRKPTAHIFIEVKELTEEEINKIAEEKDKKNAKKVAIISEQKVETKVEEKIEDVSEEIKEEVAENIEESVEEIKEATEEVEAKVEEKIEDVSEEIKEEVAENIEESVEEVKEVTEEIETKVEEKIEDVSEEIKEEVVENIEKSVEEVKEAAEEIETKVEEKE